MDGMMNGGGFGWLWMLVPLLFWGGLLVLIAWIVVRVFPARRGENEREVSTGRAEEILRERFARGEIDAEEYEKTLEVLRRERNDTKGGA